MTKKIVSFTLDEKVVDWLDSQDLPRSIFVNQLLHDQMELSDDCLSNFDLTKAVSEILYRLDKLERRLDGSDFSEISDRISDAVPVEVREWVEFQLESKGYISWGEDKASWIALGVGDSGRTFRSYMSDCGLVYDRSARKWLLVN